MRKRTVPAGCVLILWRIAPAWRNGEAGERRWRWYRCFTPRDAESFMQHQAPHGKLFEYKIKK